MNVKKFTEASILSAIFVVLSVLCISIGLGYFGYIDFIVPAFVGIIMLKCDFRYTILSCISSLLIIIFVIGDLPSGIMISQSMILGIIITYFIKKDESILNDIFFSCILACVLMIFVDINFSTLTGYSFLKESRDYLNFIPSQYENYKDIFLYISIASIPLGTTLIGYIMILISSKRFKIENSLVMNKAYIIKNFKKLSQFIYCSKSAIYIGTAYIFCIMIMNEYVFKNKYSYIVILLNSIMYISIYFIFYDSFSTINKCVYAITKSKMNLLTVQFILIYFLLTMFKYAFAVMIILSLYFDHRYSLKLKYKQMFENYKKEYLKSV